MGAQSAVQTVTTQPFTDQKPGTSGLRKRVKVFQQQHYLPNFIASLFLVLRQQTKDGEAGVTGDGAKTVLVGGDGRYFGKEAIEIIARLAAGYQDVVDTLLIAKDGILSTPAASNIVRERKIRGAILLTASHNPGGPDGDFGVKWNGANGGPVKTSVTEKIFKQSLDIKSYDIAQESETKDLDITKLGSSTLSSGLKVEVIDGVDDYVKLMHKLFDIPAIKKFLQSSPDFKVVLDSMSGVTGPYAKRVFVEELGFPADSVSRATPLPDFGGAHPDPNLIYAKDTVDRVFGGSAAFGACWDGDGDRNMILGAQNTFVTPSDSVAIIAANHQLIPYFKSGLKGVARSMPTSRALDRVAQKLGIQAYEVPTGWKFFGNLMDSGRCSLCGEESFGTGGDFVREKDGIFAVMAWLQILAGTGKSVREILQKHYDEFGRNVFQRFDFEEVDSEAGAKVMAKLRAYIDSQELVGTTLGQAGKVAEMDDFSYHDPVDGSVAPKQGVRIIFEDTSRLIIRLSGTGTTGATIRVYLEKYLPPRDDLVAADPTDELRPLAMVAYEYGGITEFTGRQSPTVTT